MKINQISFFNIGVSKKKQQDFYDVLKPGIAVLSGDYEYALIKFTNENDLSEIKIFNHNLDWWDLATNHLIKINKFKVNKKFLSGLLQCADQEDQDGLYEFANNKNKFVKFEKNSNNNSKNIDLFCIKQSIEDNFSFYDNYLIKDGKKINIKKIFGSFDKYESLIVYAN
tara:strand:- start:1112 stop:1618 length:507 start_codon:yes stop_codon:yes gene_type:complete